MIATLHPDFAACVRISVIKLTMFLLGFIFASSCFARDWSNVIESEELVLDRKVTKFEVRDSLGCSIGVDDAVAVGGDILSLKFSCDLSIQEISEEFALILSRSKLRERLDKIASITYSGAPGRVPVNNMRSLYVEAERSEQWRKLTAGFTEENEDDGKCYALSFIDVMGRAEYFKPLAKLFAGLGYELQSKASGFEDCGVISRQEIVKSGKLPGKDLTINWYPRSSMYVYLTIKKK